MCFIIANLNCLDCSLNVSVKKGRIRQLGYSSGCRVFFIQSSDQVSYNEELLMLFIQLTIRYNISFVSRTFLRPNDQHNRLKNRPLESEFGLCKSFYASKFMDLWSTTTQRPEIIGGYDYLASYINVLCIWMSMNLSIFVSSSSFAIYVFYFICEHFLHLCISLLCPKVLVTPGLAASPLNSCPAGL